MWRAVVPAADSVFDVIPGAAKRLPGIQRL